MSTEVVTASDWIKGIALSIAASMIGGASKLAIRKSWLIEQAMEGEQQPSQRNTGRSLHDENLQDTIPEESLPENVDDSIAPNSSDHYAPPPLTPQETCGTAATVDVSASSLEQDNFLPTETPAVATSPTRQQRGDSRLWSGSFHSSLKKSSKEKEGYNSINNDDDNDSSHNECQVFDIEDPNNDTVNSSSFLPCGSCVPCGGNVEDEEDEEEDSLAEDGGEDDSETDEERLIRRRHCRKMCLAYTLRGGGMIGMTFLNPLCSVLAMNYASPSILAPFSGLTLVWIILLSQPLIGEQPTVRQVVAASLIVVGEIVVAVYGDHTNGLQDASLEDLRQSYSSVPFLLYIACLIIWMLLLFYWMKSEKTSPTLKRFSWGVAGGSVTGLQNFLKDSLSVVKILEKQKDKRSLSSLENGSYVNDGMLVALSAVHGFPWYLPLMIFLAIATAFGGLLLLTACMKRYDATYSAAMFVGSFVISATVMSAVHYSTFVHLQNVVNWIMYPSGLLILMSGIWMLILEKQQENGEHGLAGDDYTSWTEVDATTLAPSMTSLTPVIGSNDEARTGHALALSPDDQQNPEMKSDECISPRRKEMQKPLIASANHHLE